LPGVGILQRHQIDFVEHEDDLLVLHGLNLFLNVPATTR
jgi:hypothetical protein